MSRHTWEGAELAFYIDGESYSFTLSDKQFECVARILGFQMNLDNGEITTYSDGTLEQFMTMKENPFRFKRVN